MSNILCQITVWIIDCTCEVLRTGAELLMPGDGALGVEAAAGLAAARVRALPALAHLRRQAVGVLRTRS